MTNYIQTNPQAIKLNDVNTSKIGKVFYFTPTWTATAGVAPAIGDGTLTGSYMYLGNDAYLVNITLIGGAATVWGGAGRYSFTAPFMAAQYTAGSAHILDNSAPLNYHAVPILAAGSQDIVLTLNAAGNVAFNTPMVWAVSDRLMLTLVVFTR